MYSSLFHPLNIYLALFFFCHSALNHPPILCTKQWHQCPCHAPPLSISSDTSVHNFYSSFSLWPLSQKQCDTPFSAKIANTQTRIQLEFRASHAIHHVTTYKLVKETSESNTPAGIDVTWLFPIYLLMHLHRKDYVVKQISLVHHYTRLD